MLKALVGVLLNVCLLAAPLLTVADTSFEKGEFWEFEVSTPVSSRSDIPNGVYKFVFDGQRMRAIDYDKTSTLNSNLALLPGLGKQPEWFRFLTEPIETWKDDRATYWKGKTSEVEIKGKKYTVTEITGVKPVKGGNGKILYLYSPDTKSIVKSEVVYSVSRFDAILLRHGKEEITK